MNNVLKRFLLAALAAGLVLAWLVDIGLNWYAGSGGVRAQAEQALSREWGAPVKIGSLQYGFWSGFRATGIRLETEGENAGSSRAASSLSIPAISAKIAWWPLFAGRVVVKRLVFKEPELVWVQGADGGWPLPLPAKPAASAKHPPKDGETSGEKPAHSKIEFQVRTVKLQKAAFRFMGQDGKPVATLDGVTVQCPLIDLANIAGPASVEKAALRDGLTLSAFAAAFTFAEGKLSVSPMSARLAGGSVRGACTLLFPAGYAPLFTLDLLFDGVSLRELQADMGVSEDARRTEGTLHGNLDIYGRTDKARSIRGFGQLRLHGGRMQQVPLLQSIGKCLPIEELQNLELRQAQLDLRASEGKIFVDSLVMESPNLGLTAKGAGDFEGRLDLAARLAINPKVSRQLPGWVESNFQPVPGSDRRDIGFAVRGTLSRPETDLVEALMGQKYGSQFMNLWQSLTGKHKKKGQKKAESEGAPAEEGDGATENP